MDLDIETTLTVNKRGKIITKMLKNLRRTRGGREPKNTSIAHEGECLPTIKI